ncbi:haloacid dehalogenase-like hydrolase [Lipingzhangella sp. LS1_29]|uniref:Haloacid dehalogenase-like hydrolase n=1 Tax=Lipingzhangella rawalii TaxID=2055835 RepID=A0ABU2HCH5_9ACTN|nr:haloacid dehalogenase-like hydrolase [Lipingzhangella rawalii]
MWSIDRTLVDVAQVTRRAYAEAFEQVTGQPLVYLTATQGLSDSELFYEFLARNNLPVDPEDDQLPFFVEALEEAFANHRHELTTKGHEMPGARAALDAVARMPGTVQTVVTGTIRANALAQLSAFGMDNYLDLEIGGFGSDTYTIASLLQLTRMRAERERQNVFPEETTIHVTNSTRGVEAARIGRAVPVAVVSGSATRGQLQNAGAEHILDDIADTAAFTSIVQRIGGNRE